MKKLLSLLFFAIVLTSCGSDDDANNRQESNSIKQLVESYDLWYVVPDQYSSDFELGQDAITFSFVENELYANKNIVGFNPNTIGNLETNYSVEQEGSNARITIDGIEFKIFGISGNSIKLINNNDNTSFYITGYNSNEFPLEILRYERMTHLFQEFKFWKKTDAENVNENEENFSPFNYLEFIPTRNFKISTDPENLNYTEISWQYQGSYALTTLEDDEGNLSNEVIFAYSEDLNRENDTLKVVVLEENKIQLSKPTQNTNYTFEGTINTPY